MSYGEACLIPGIPVTVRRLALTGGEGRLKGPRGDFLWHLSPRMEDASLGELQPQPLSLRFGVLAQRDPRDPLGGSGGETPFPTLPEDMTARVWKREMGWCLVAILPHRAHSRVCGIICC